MNIKIQQQLLLKRKNKKKNKQIIIVCVWQIQLMNDKIPATHYTPPYINLLSCHFIYFR